MWIFVERHEAQETWSKYNWVSVADRGRSVDEETKSSRVESFAMEVFMSIFFMLLFVTIYLLNTLSILREETLS